MRYDAAPVFLRAGASHRGKRRDPDILGDTVYGAKKPVPGLTGQCLHATGLRFIHPRTHEPVELTCPLPEEFTRMLAKLEKKQG